ncbi:MAG TPA: phospholipase D-like domain-containing protein, partial [Steroidobacteraceae bacterium]
RVFGARGPLSSRQSKAILGRLAAQSPDAGTLERHLAVEQAIAASPLFIGNHVRILRDGAETFPAMFAAIRQATRYVYLEYYIFEDVAWDGETLSDLLVQQSEAGVHVHVIYDGIGSIGTGSAFFDKLRAAGVQIAEFNPPNPWKHHFALNSRDHRKLLVADGTVAILGGVNLSSTYQSGPSSAGEALPTRAADSHKPQDVWHDTDIQIRGPVVPELEKFFREHWREQQGVPLEGTPTPILLHNRRAMKSSVFLAAHR